MCAISIAFHFYLLIILTLNIKQKQLLKLYLAFYLKKKSRTIEKWKYHSPLFL